MGKIIRLIAAKLARRYTTKARLTFRVRILEEKEALMRGDMDILLEGMEKMDASVTRSLRHLSTALKPGDGLRNAVPKSYKIN